MHFLSIINFNTC